MSKKRGHDPWTWQKREKYQYENVFGDNLEAKRRRLTVAQWLQFMSIVNTIPPKLRESYHKVAKNRTMELVGSGFLLKFVAMMIKRMLQEQMDNDQIQVDVTARSTPDKMIINFFFGEVRLERIVFHAEDIVIDNMDDLYWSIRWRVSRLAHNLNRRYEDMVYANEQRKLLGRKRSRSNYGLKRNVVTRRKKKDT